MVMGEKPICFVTLVLFATFLVLPNLSNLFNVLTLLVGGIYCMRKRGHGKTWERKSRGRVGIVNAVMGGVGTWARD